MTMNKKILAVAILGGLFSSAANAQVILSNPASTANPTLYASEITITPGTGTSLAAVVQNELKSALNYSFSGSEIRYARVECSSNYRITSGPATIVTTVTDNTAVANALTGAINGLGTNAISFSITAPVGGLVATNAIRVEGARNILSTAAATCTYSLYDQPSQAAAGGPAGLIATSGTKPAANFSASLALRTIPNNLVANVESNPAFSQFLVGGVNTSTGHVGRTVFDLVNAASGILADNPVLPQPRLTTGLVPASPAELVAAGSFHTISGDFSLASNTDGTYTGDALLRVYLATNATCPVAGAINANTLTATSARFNTGSTILDRFVCLTARTGGTIAVATYAQTFNAVSVAGFTVPNIGPVALGDITRNGTSLQAPFVQLPAGYLARMVLTNTSAVNREYVISVMSEDGNTVGTANLTGTLIANRTRVVELNTVLTSFSGLPRATINITVAAPNASIQGLYQIVRPDTGAISNHVMVRPGTN